MPPSAHLAVACLDEVTGRELAARRALLLGALGSAGPEEIPEALAGALALTAVITEQDTRARTYAAYLDSPYGCTCGFRCLGLAAINDHLDEYGLDDDDHNEISRPSPVGTQLTTGLTHHGREPREMTQLARVPGKGYAVPDGWFEAEDRPHVLRMNVPLSAEEMVAALYRQHDRLTPDELASDQDVWGHIAVTLLAEGQPAIGYADQQIREAEESGSGVRAPAWLAFCRRRVAEVTGCTPATAPDVI